MAKQKPDDLVGRGGFDVEHRADQTPQQKAAQAPAGHVTITNTATGEAAYLTQAEWRKLADKAPGQQKVHTISNAATGETMDVTQAEWRKFGKALRAAGFDRPADLPAEPGVDQPPE